MKRETNKRASTRAAEAEAAPSRYAFWLGLLSAFGWAAAILGMAWGFHALEQYVRAAQPRVECRLKFVDVPAWLRQAPWVQDKLLEVSDLRPEDDINDPNLCAWVGRGLLKSAWVAKLHSVTKCADGTVHVKADFREPVAYVLVGKRAYMIDAEAVCVPADYPADDPNTLATWFGITGVAAPLPQQGQVWPGEDLAKGLKLVQYLRQEDAHKRLPFRSSLGPVDVSDYYLKGRSTGLLRIRTVYPGCYVDWGLPPGEESDVDTATASRKLDMLNTVYRDNGRLPDKDICVRWLEGAKLSEPRKRSW